MLHIRGLLSAVACGNRWPQLAHTASTGPVRRFPSVRSPTRLSKPHTGAHRAEFGFSPQNGFTPPPKGGGAEFCSSLGFRVLLGSCLWQPLATTGSHGPNRACSALPWCRSPIWPPKLHTGAYRAEFRFHRFFFLDFLGGSPASWRSRW